MQTNSPAILANQPTTALQAAISAALVLPVPYRELSPQVIRDLPLETLRALQQFLATTKSELANLSAILQAGLEMTYAEQARAQLLAQGKDTGTTHLEVGDYDISVEIGKDLSWDAKGLADLVNKIAASGGNPAEYVTVKYSVSEAKYKSWPQHLREPFEALRTVTPKAPKFSLRVNN